MTRAIFVALAAAIALVAAAPPADAHVGSPDVFFEGDAGPYRLFVTIRTPQVIPGIATIEIRSESPDVTGVSVVPMRLTGPGSELPPTPDRAERSTVDPRFFSASLWLMERGSMQVRISVDGARGAGALGVPVPAAARTTLAMDRGTGALLFALMLVLALALVSIAAGAVREVALEPGTAPSARARRRTRVAAIVAGVAVTAAIALGNLWWSAEASTYARMVARPWRVDARADGCRLTIRAAELPALLPDHGHDMHLFLVRAPALDQLAHLHPTRPPDGDFGVALPSLPAGRYHLFADVVLANGYAVTGTAELDLPASTCGAPEGDDATWAGGAPPGDGTRAPLADGASMVWDRPAHLAAGVAQPLRFHVENADGTPATLEPYMGMAGHAEIVVADGSVFAHLHPSGSVAMPALQLARANLAGAHAQTSMSMPMPMPPTAAMPPMPGMSDATTIPPELAFPYGFPHAGTYRVFVQVKHAGRIVTGAFDARVE